MCECAKWFEQGSLKDPCRSLSRKFKDTEEMFPTAGMIADIRKALDTGENICYAFTCRCGRDYSLASFAGWACH